QPVGEQPRQQQRHHQQGGGHRAQDEGTRDVHCRVAGGAVSPSPWLSVLSASPSASPSASALPASVATTSTLLPSCSRSSPSSTTRSPASRPSTTATRSPCAAPNCTWRTLAVSSPPIT